MTSMHARASIPAPPAMAYQTAVWGLVPEGAYWIGADGIWNNPDTERPAGLMTWFTHPNPDWWRPIAFKQLADAHQQLRTPVSIEVANLSDDQHGIRVYGLPVWRAGGECAPDYVRVVLEV